MQKSKFEEEKSKKLKLGTYPYTYARVSAMKSKLISKSEYDKLIKMGISALTNYLESTDYKQQINELGSTLSQYELFEQAIHKNLVDTFTKLKKISTDEVDIIIDHYIERWDVYNLVTVLRAIHSKAPAEEAESLLIAAGVENMPYFVDLLKSESIQQVLEKSRALPKAQMLRVLEEYEKRNSIYPIETALYRQYYEKLLKFSESFPEEAEHIKNFILDEIDVVNIKTLLRLKRENAKTETILSNLIMHGAKLNHTKLKELAAKPTFEELIEGIKKSGFREFFSDKSSDFLEAEIELGKYLLAKSFSRSHMIPLSMTSILQYMFAKEIEVKNLRGIVKAKQLGLSEETIEKKVIVV